MVTTANLKNASLFLKKVNFFQVFLFGNKVFIASRVTTEPHLLVKVHSASAPWLNHCRSQCNIRLAAEIDIVIFEWQQEGVGKQRLSNSCLKTGAGKAEVEQWLP